MTRDFLPSQKRIACVICGYPIALDRLIDHDWPQTCGDPECDHRAMGVDILDVARRVGATLRIPSKPPAQS